MEYRSRKPQMPTETLSSTLLYKLLELFIEVFWSNHLQSVQVIAVHSHIQWNSSTFSPTTLLNPTATCERS